MKNYRLLCYFFSCFFILSCVSTSNEIQRPLWIDNAQSLYPDSDYLSAVGQGTKRARAGKNAMANLAEIFYVSVRAETTTLTEATKVESALGVSMESSTSLQRNIQTKTDQALSGVKIKHSWLSPTGEYYALALLEKRTAAMNFHELIIAFDTSTLGLIDYANNSAPNSIAALNALRAARDEQMARQMANLQLKQVSYSGLPADISSKQIEKLIAKKLASMQVAVDINNEKQAKIVQSGLAQLGISVVENAAIIVSAEIDITEPMLLSSWYWLRGSYVLSITENGQVISRQRWPIKVSAQQKSLLDLRLQDTITRNISQYLTALISDPPTL